MLDYYGLLGVREDATNDEIRRAHRAKLLEVHPDTHQGDKDAEETAKRLGEAKQVLLDPKTRQLYDAARRQAQDADGEGIDVSDAIRLFETATGIKLEQAADSVLDFARQRFHDFLRGTKR